MVYFVARMSFYKSDQKTLAKKECDEKPIELVERLLRENPEYDPDKAKKGEEKKGIGLLFGNFILDRDRLIAMKVGRSQELLWEDYDKNQQKFIESSKTKFPYALMLWDRDEQVIIVERKTTIFPNIQTFFKSLEYHFNSLLRPYEIMVSIIPLTSDIDFWNTIARYKEIYNVTFNLKMPNLFGHTNDTVKEILEQYKQENNAAELTTKISNQNGTLEIIKDSWVTPVLNWIKVGGGYWSIKCAKKRHGVRENIRSTDNAIKIDSSKEFMDDSAEDAKLIIQSLRTEYQIKGDTNEDEKTKTDNSD